MKDSKYFERFKNEVLYLIDEETESIIKSDPLTGYYIKTKGGKEAPIEADNSIVVRAIHAKDLTTETVYTAF